VSVRLATLVYVREGGRTLMLHRNKRPSDTHFGKWNGLGGKFEPGESPEACMRREVREESGLEVEDALLKGFITFPAFEGGHDWYTFVYLVTKTRGTVAADPPEGTLAWVPSTELLSLNLWEGDRIFLPWLDQGRFFSAVFRYQGGRLGSHDVVFYPAP
jgi:8-oxo-dGTP diphosphatase